MSCNAGRNADQDHARGERLHDHRAQDTAGDRPDPAGERRATDDRGRDDLQLDPRPEPVRGCVQAGRGHDGRDSGEHAHQDEGLHDRHPGIDAGQHRGLGIAADGVHVAPESASRGQPGHDHGDAEGDEDRDGDPVRDVAPGGTLIPCSFAYFAASRAATGSCWQSTPRRPRRGCR